MGNALNSLQLVPDVVYITISTYTLYHLTAHSLSHPTLNLPALPKWKQ